MTKGRVIAALVVLCAAVGGYFAYRHYSKLGAGADVTRFVPADAVTVFHVPRLDQAAEALSKFTRGINEAARLREYLKAETGADLGSRDGLRQVGVDPEAGMAIYAKNGLYHLLFGVEDPLKLSTAISAKFVNLGYPAPKNAANEDTTVVRTVLDKNNEPFAVYAARDGLMAVVYSAGGADPAAGLEAVFDTSSERFFDSEKYKNASQKVTGEGPFFYVDGSLMPETAHGNSRASFVDGLGLPDVASAFIKPSIESYLKRINFAAARMSIEPCASAVSMTLDVDGDARVLPASWMLPDSSTAPDFGKMMPRDTVVMLRLALNTTGVSEMVTRMTSGLANLGNMLGMGGSNFDPIAGILGGQVHPDLADRHVIKDVVNHLTGHISVSLAGLGKKAKLSSLIRPRSANEFLSAVQLVLALQLKDGKAFWTKWKAKQDVLQKLGFKVDELVDEEWEGLRLQRNCGRPARARGGRRGAPPPCEHYGLIYKDDMLVVTSGNGTLERVFQTITGQASDMRGLTREPMAELVLDHGPMLVGAYFSFDGLLKAVANKNLPGGATRYLAQMYELAFSLNSASGGTTTQLLLTR